VNNHAVNGWVRTDILSINSGNRKKSVVPLALLSALISLFVLSGCAEKGPILLDIDYQQPGGVTPTSKKIVVGVSPLKDGRNVPAAVLGKRKAASGIENDLVTQGTVADLVLSRLKTALKARGISVQDAAEWNGTAENMPLNGADILLGGEIETLWIESTSVPFKTSLKGSVQLKIVAGDVAEKKIIRTLEVSSKVGQDVLYSREKLESVLSEALSSALDQIFTDSVLEIKLQ
jgi:hypothetical protein